MLHYKVGDTIRWLGWKPNESFKVIRIDLNEEKVYGLFFDKSSPNGKETYWERAKSDLWCVITKSGFKNVPKESI